MKQECQPLHNNAEIGNMNYKESYLNALKNKAVRAVKAECNYWILMQNIL
jgi:hypothetical protein